MLNSSTLWYYINMPKDKVDTNKADEPKKKMVVVEEVEAPIETLIETPVIDSEVVPKEVLTEEVKVIEADQDKPNYLFIIIPTALLFGALVGGLITYFSGISKLDDGNTTPSPIATVVPSVEPSPVASSSASFKRETVKLQVLNGSGVSGLAGKAKTYLESLGYKDVITGNASVSNLTETTISVKESKKDLVENIRTDLAKNYKVAKETETLIATSKYDFVITLGSK